jgi:hypothetical protein
MLRKLYNILLLVLLCGPLAGAQEFNCKVTIMSDKIKSAGIDPQLFTGMQKAIQDFMNTRRWTTDEFASAEKIDCNIFINLTNSNIGGDPNAFSGTFSIQASRPVYNASYTTTIVNYVDKDFAFKYSQFNPLNFDNNRVSGADALSSNITAVIAYYAYMVLAMDYDSFSPMGGTPYLKLAQGLVNNAPDGKGISGWKSVDNNRNRYWLVDQMLNLRFKEVRNFWYMMHREGLDSMSTKPIESRTRILTNVKKLYQVNRENPSSVILQFILSAKSNEFLQLVEAAPKSERQQYISMLAVIDVPNSNKYNLLK